MLVGESGCASPLSPNYTGVPMIEIFEKLENTSSTLEKEAILKDNQHSEDLKLLLKLNLDPYKNYFIHKFVLPTSGAKKSTATELSELLKELSERTITGNEARNKVKSFFEGLDPIYQKLYKKILLKEALGVGIKTVNKVFGKDFVPEFRVMLAPNELADIATLSYPVYIQPKLDGFRCVVIPDNEGFKFYSRTGRYFGNSSLLNHFKCLNNLGSYVLDGELYAHGESFDNIASTLNSESKKIPASLKFHVFDCIPYENWLAQKYEGKYEQRVKQLRQIVNSINDYSKVIDVPTDLCETQKEVVDLYKRYLKEGYEGCMVKSSDGVYQWKRVTANNGAMLKLKPFSTVDVAVEGIYDGEGNFEGMAGGITFNYKGVSVRCGSGFSHDLRKDMAKNPSDYIGKIVEVKFFEETEEGSLRFPTFVRIRTDKE